MRIAALIVIAITICLSGCLRAYRKVNPAKPPEYTVIVRADRSWQDSNIRVRSGEVIQFRAEGRWNDHFNYYGPEGNPEVYKKHFGVNAPANSLIMQLTSQTNTAYFIGKQTNIVVERSGEMRFRKNYSLPIGMDGEIKVKIRVCSDADSDGISDYDEINIWKTNPLSADTDGDAFSDFEEISEIQSRIKDKR